MKTSYRVGEVASLLGFSSQMVRKYEQMGLLSPLREENNYRLYESPDVTMMMRIRLLRNLGFSMEEVGQAFSPGRDHSLEEMYQTRIAQMEEEIHKLAILIECAKLQQAYCCEYEERKGAIRFEKSPALRYILYREGRSILPAFLEKDLLSSLLMHSPPLQYFITIQQPKEKGTKEEYGVGLAVPDSLSEYVPSYEGEGRLPSQTCATVILRHVVEKKNQLWETISIRQAFEDSGIFSFLKEKNLTLCGDVFGLTYFDEVEGNLFIHYIKYFFPVKEEFREAPSMGKAKEDEGLFPCEQGV